MSAVCRGCSDRRGKLASSSRAGSELAAVDAARCALPGADANGRRAAGARPGGPDGRAAGRSSATALAPLAGGVAGRIRSLAPGAAVALRAPSDCRDRVALAIGLRPDNVLAMRTARTAPPHVARDGRRAAVLSQSHTRTRPRMPARAAHCMCGGWSWHIRAIRTGAALQPSAAPSRAATVDTAHSAHTPHSAPVRAPHSTRDLQSR